MEYGRTRDPDMLARNPNAVIPTIEDDGFVVWESNVILRYLSRKYGLMNVYPEEVELRTDVERWMDWQQTTVGPSMVPVFWGLVRTAPELRDHDAIDKSRDRYEHFMSMLNERLGVSQHVAGSEFSMADIPVGIMAYRWFNLDIERADLANLARWYEGLTQRPAFKNNIMIGLT